MASKNVKRLDFGVVRKKPVAKTAKPATKSAVKPLVKPATKPAVKPLVKPVTKPAVKTVTKSAVKPLVKPATKPVIKPATRSTLKTTSKLAAQPAIRSTAKTTTKPLSKPLSKPLPKPLARPTQRPVANTTLRKPTTGATEAVRQPISRVKRSTAAENAHTAPSEAPREPVMANHGRFIDFVPVRPKKPEKVPQKSISTFETAEKDDYDNSYREEPVEIETTAVKETIEIASTPEASRRRTAPRGFHIDFMRRPKLGSFIDKIIPSADDDEEDSDRQDKIDKRNEEYGDRQEKIGKRNEEYSDRQDKINEKSEEYEDSDEFKPLMSDNDLAVALASFAENPDTKVSTTPRHDATTLRHDAALRRNTAPRHDTVSSQSAYRDSAFSSANIRETTAFEEELDALNELSDNIVDGMSTGDDIDAIEAEIEAETSDFVKEPKPLFEDPLVKKSKVREERESIEEAERTERLKEEARERARENARRAPYAALYSADHSPFLASVTVEKRPLSAAAPQDEGKRSNSNSGSGFFGRQAKHTPVKNTYSSRMQKQLDDDAKEIHRQTMVMTTPEPKSHHTALTIAIILTILLGAGVGAVIYLVFFQK